MPSFRFQSNIHLNGFQVLDACLENVTSFEGLDDKLPGRIVFLTSGDTNPSYLHPAVYNGTNFKGIALLDDIEALINGEGSLGTRVKALEDMLGLEDVTDVIDTWNDVKAFFANVDEGLNLMDLLNSKFDKTGGTISTDEATNTPLVIKSQYDGIDWVGIAYENKVGRLGALGFKSDGTPLYVASNKVDTYPLIHTGNALDQLKGTFLPLTGGTITSQYFFPLIIKRDSTQGVTIRYVNSSGALGNIGIGVFDDGNHPIFGDDTTNYKLIHEGNVGDYTAGAAKKLETAVYLWGNEFDGTADVFGTIKVKDGENNWLSALGLTNNNLHLGYGTRTLGLAIWGTPIEFYANSTRAMTIDDAGNVFVGVVDQGIIDYKLEVGGLSRIYAAGQSMALGKVPTNGLVLGAHFGLQGQFYFDYSGNICLQGQNVSDSTTRALNLNPLGGAVNIGSTNSYTNVIGPLQVATQIYVGNSSSSYIAMQREGYNYIWANKQNSSIQLGVGDLSNKATLAIYKDSIEAGTTNAVSLGTSSYRWSNVYSVGGNFSENVAIGNTLSVGGQLRLNYDGDGIHFGGEGKSIHWHDADGAWVSQIMNFASDAVEVYNKFSVKGLATFNGGALIPTGQTLTIGSVTFRETAAGEVEVDGNLHTTGTLASGGKGEAGENTTGNAMVYQYDLASGESVYTVDNVKGSTNVIVQIFEWNSNTSSWDMILTDVSVKADAITVTFGRTTTVNHMVTVC